MERGAVKPRAVIFDVYCTILEVGPPPADAAERWLELWRETFRSQPRLTGAEFGAACRQVVSREHAAARGAGIPHPEIHWPAVVAEVVPELAALSGAGREEFIFRQIGLGHAVRLMPGAAATLRGLQQAGVHLGIASNAQPYTLRELAGALAPAGLAPDLFEPGLTFWSFAHGFSKPDPHVFRLLTARLGALGVAPGETLMVGDRLDNDIAPARAQGWQAWQLMASPGPDAGDWPQLAARLGLS
jgi:FMN phosphatase YigB (HAD superfamily)